MSYLKSYWTSGLGDPTKTQYFDKDVASLWRLALREGCALPTDEGRGADSQQNPSKAKSEGYSHTSGLLQEVLARIPVVMFI